MRGEQPETAAAPAPSDPESSLPIVEFKLLWDVVYLEMLGPEGARKVEAYFEANGWVRVKEKSLPKVLNELGSEGWEIAHWEEERVVLRRSKSRSEAGYQAVEYYVLAHAAHWDGDLGATFSDPIEEYVAEGWKFLDAAPGGLRGKLNALGSKGWNLVTWTRDFAILRRPKGR